MSRILCAGAVISIMMSVGTAHAALFNVEYRGVISGGSDANNDFVGTNADLSGMSILVRYTFDDAIGSTTRYSGGALYSGGSAFGNVSPLLSATITIGSRSLTMDGRVTGLMREESTASSTYRYHEADAADGSILSSSVTAAAGAMPDSLFVPFSYVVSSTDRAFGSLTLADGTSVDFTPTSLVSTVPLPMSLPLFAAGLVVLGAAGAVGRRRQAIPKSV